MLNQRVLPQPYGGLERRGSLPKLEDSGTWIIIPCYRVTSHIEAVIAAIPAWCAGVVCVDDACPDGSGDYIRHSVTDPRVVVIGLATNQGVGGAVLAGYAEALRRGARLLVKVDGDDQMDLSYVSHLVVPILLGEADYSKGNRFTSGGHLKSMPWVRVFGNAALSFAAKLSTGYWNVFDPTNGFTAIEGSVAHGLLEKQISRRYFFETDLLYHLGTLRAVVRDVPIPARYGHEISNLKIASIVIPFSVKHISNFWRRIVGQYFVRDFHAATLELMIGSLLLIMGASYGFHWLAVRAPGQAASAGVVMAAALPVIVGVQLLLQTLNFDVLNTPSRPIHPYLRTIAAIEQQEDDHPRET